MKDTTAKPDLLDRHSGNPSSPHYEEEIFEHYIATRLNGNERFDVQG